MTAPAGVLELVRRFRDNRSEYLSSHYNETQARHEFIDPLLMALGWDVNNSAGYAEAYKDVVHEDSIKVGGATKAPDYCLRIGGFRKFFVEAKRPGVNIKEDASAAYQIRRYAWSAKLPLSILTDFEELAVYDCRIRPALTDKPSLARTKFWTYGEYEARWDEISGIFSREAILKGSFDHYAESNKTKHGTAEVDDAFLADIERWRGELAANLALRNPSLTRRDLNYAVQQTIDRIVFLRICEDRGIEVYGRLRDATSGHGVYVRLLQLFREADLRYNSGLFHFGAEKGRPESPDTLTAALVCDDRILKEMIWGLYYPDSPYEFSVLSADILGQVYEQFLGKVIVLDAKHHAKVEDKPEVKKAGGIYYTPTYIVEYIVKHTVAELLEGRTPGPNGDASKLRILDPACGSGSFLIAAYQHLLDWHLARYTAVDPERWARGRSPCVCQGPNGDWRLTPAERKRILLNSIYGVDIDPQAVETAKLSLLLKVLEGETEQTLATQLTFAPERALPDLAANLRCGNSLIDNSFYQRHPVSMFDEEAQYRINVFDWKAEFPWVFAAPGSGFDAIIGNPPYIRIQAMKEWAPVEVEYYKQAYRSASKGSYDIYVTFVERGLSLLSSAGRLGYILPHKFFTAKYGEPLRALLSEGRHIDEVVHFGDQQVFEGATTYTCLMFLSKAACERFQYVEAHDLEKWRSNTANAEIQTPAVITPKGEWDFASGDKAALIQRLRDMPVVVRDLAERIGQGIRTGANEVYVLDVRDDSSEVVTAYSKILARDVQLEKAALAPFVQGRDIRPYAVLQSGKAVLFPYRTSAGVAQLIPEPELRGAWPKAWAYLAENKTLLEAREGRRFAGPQWYCYSRSQNIDLMRLSKILVPDIADRSSFALDGDGKYAFVSGYGITLKASPNASKLYVLCLLNSKLLDYYLKTVSTTMRGGFFRYFTQYIEKMPIRLLDRSLPGERETLQTLESLSEKMHVLKRTRASASSPSSASMLVRQMTAIDAEIDRLVYELYGLTDEEIALVEAQAPKPAT